MEARRRIVVYGNSVILGTIGANLRRCPRFDVATLVPAVDDAEQLEAARPSTVLFDLEAAVTDALFSILKTEPTLLLIGVSPDVNFVRVWSVRQLRELSMRQLIEVIESGFLGGEHPS